MVVESDAVALPRPIDLLDAGSIARAVPRLRPRVGACVLRGRLHQYRPRRSPARRSCRAGALYGGDPDRGGGAARGGAGSRFRGRVWCCRSPGDLPRESNELSGLSLAAGVALVDELASGGLGHVMLKWPNDLVVDDRKIAGILVEASHSRSGSIACVIGVGFNVDLAPVDSGPIDQPWTDFARAFGRIPARSTLAARAANALLDACEQYRDHGLESFAARWSERDALRGRLVRALSRGVPIVGIARGIDSDGALLIEHPEGIVRCESGEVTVRALEA